MCRVLAYLGEPLLLQHQLYDTDNSLVRQSYSPRMMNTFLNLAGFGVLGWDRRSVEPETPFAYRVTQLPAFDPNLRELAGKLAPSCMIAHVRGVTYSGQEVIADTNLHPFRFRGARVALATEGTPSPACVLVINGAVEKVIVRGAQRIRVGLAGPGHALAYESLIDGGPSTTTAITRERALLLLLPEAAFARLFGDETAGSDVFLDVILRDLTAALRQTTRPQAHLAVSR